MKEIDSEKGTSYAPKNTQNYQTCKGYNAWARAYFDNLIFRPIKENQVCYYFYQYCF